jgi:uncharacterized protein YggU (UPF0235/DUF167 family)
MIAVMPHAQGAILPVRAKPGAKENELIDEHNGLLRLAVTAPPESGKANTAIVRLLAETLNLRRAQIILLGGAASRIKRFLITGISPEDLLARIAAALEPTLLEPPDADVD